MIAPLKLTLKSPQDTAALAARLGGVLQPGDTILLEGSIGSGKTHFARALIQSVLKFPEDVPSPTFTLVQIYETGIGEVWHSDLYRLTTVEEVEELGLVDAFDTGICLVEWPAKLGPLTPQPALLIQFITNPNDHDMRQLALSWSDPKWNAKLEMIQ
ncbi:tRNA threonylcarbamoyladenosine biosynthesis protein TsaE [Ruegeria halocynthiae]|uniref:tRNA threonylcarbamoyladenosine biosynthesis protein TsaE n=1 Tax=Ruegeria halocynthiae TaxID=985054 RepID=A0A1H3BHZ3_9RHOB|nr:tRNA (adenosine(37)-N6)-threonylcarbamoyltransferase complex ATPase subunit type 1 TsaE [Ruegeria halocynthiae]SDX41338.1 tRNA threonylcarbamoyladenosine biosynthesis protein TsaE [Ruegeria halocynthiae]